MWCPTWTCGCWCTGDSHSDVMVLILLDNSPDGRCTDDVRRGEETVNTVVVRWLYINLNKKHVKSQTWVENSNHLLLIDASIYVYLFLYLFYIYLSLVYSLSGHVFRMTLVLRCKNWRKKNKNKNKKDSFFYSFNISVNTRVELY